MMKTVNVKTTLPVRNIEPKLNGNTMYPRLKLSSSDILNCMLMRASVDEVLADNSLIRLDRSNYNKINGDIPSENISIVQPNGIIENAKPKIKDEFIPENDCFDPKSEAIDPPEVKDDEAKLPASDTKEISEIIDVDVADEAHTADNEESIEHEDNEVETSNDSDIDGTSDVKNDEASEVPSDPEVVTPPTAPTHVIQNNNQNQNKNKKKH